MKESKITKFINENKELTTPNKNTIKNTNKTPFIKEASSSTKLLNYVNNNNKVVYNNYHANIPPFPSNYMNNQIYSNLNNPTLQSNANNINNQAFTNNSSANYNINYNNTNNNNLINNNIINTDNSEIKTKKRLRVHSNLLFAFQNDHIYESMYSESEDFPSFNNQTNNNNNQSNFFSTFNDYSHWINANNDNCEINYENDKEAELEDKENILDDTLLQAIEADMQKNLEFLNEDDDNLNDAKLDEGSSIFTEKYYDNLEQNINDHNQCNPNAQSFSANINPINSNSSSFVDYFSYINKTVFPRNSNPNNQVLSNNNCHYNYNTNFNNPSNINNTNNLGNNINNNALNINNNAQNVNNTHTYCSETSLETNYLLNSTNSNCFIPGINNTIHVHKQHSSIFNNLNNMNNNTNYNNYNSRNNFNSLNTNNTNQSNANLVIMNTGSTVNLNTNNNTNNINVVNKNSDSIIVTNTNNTDTKEIKKEIPIGLTSSPYISSTSSNIANARNVYNTNNSNKINMNITNIPTNSNFFINNNQNTNKINMLKNKNLNCNANNNFLMFKNNNMLFPNSINNNTFYCSSVFDHKKFPNNPHIFSISKDKKQAQITNNKPKASTLGNEEKLILDNIKQFVKDSNKCRIVQNKFDEKKDFYIYFFEKVKSMLAEIICDPFGNYVCQKFIETCPDPKYISYFIEHLKPNLYQVAINSYGTRGLQKLFEYLNTEKDLSTIQDFLLTNLIDLIKDNTGNHVVQQAIVFYPRNCNDFLYEEVKKNITLIAKIKQGGCVITKLFHFATETQKESLCESVIKNISELINDEFGNFIIQQVYKFKQDKYSKPIFDYVCINLTSLSKQKFSSNIIDKCILVEQYGDKNRLAEILLQNNSIINVIIDKYGNYIVKSLLSTVKESLFLEIIEIIKKKLKRIRNSPYGDKIYSSLMNRYKEYLGGGLLGTSNITGNISNNDMSNSNNKSKNQCKKTNNNNVNGNTSTLTNTQSSNKFYYGNIVSNNGKQYKNSNNNHNDIVENNYVESDKDISPIKVNSSNILSSIVPNKLVNNFNQLNVKNNVKNISKNNTLSIGYSNIPITPINYHNNNTDNYKLHQNKKSKMTSKINNINVCKIEDIDKMDTTENNLDTIPSNNDKDINNKNLIIDEKIINTKLNKKENEESYAIECIPDLMKYKLNQNKCDNKNSFSEYNNKEGKKYDSEAMKDNLLNNNNDIANEQNYNNNFDVNDKGNYYTYDNNESEAYKTNKTNNTLIKYLNINFNKNYYVSEEKEKEQELKELKDDINITYTTNLENYLDKNEESNLHNNSISTIKSKIIM